jgi:hypothetical protein
MIEARIHIWPDVPRSREIRIFIGGKLELSYFAEYLELVELAATFTKAAGDMVLKDDPQCRHESDGMIYTSNPPQNKCKKCGAFYR